MSDILSYIFILIFGGCIGYIAAVLFNYYYEGYLQQSAFLERLRYVSTKSDSVSVLNVSLNAKKQDALSRFMERYHVLLKHFTAIQTILRRCGPEMGVTKYFIVNIVFVSAMICFLLFVARSSLFSSIMLGSALGVFGAYQYAAAVASRREANFLRLFPEALETLMRAVRSGATIHRAISVVATQAHEPIASVFTTITDQINLGVPLDTALRSMADVLLIDDFRFFAIVLSIQQETGGALSEILANLTALVRNRHQIKLKLRALSAEARTSAIVVGALPFALSVILYFLNPDHLKVFVTTEMGSTLLNVAIGLMATGAFVMWRMTNIKI